MSDEILALEDFPKFTAQLHDVSPEEFIKTKKNLLLLRNTLKIGEPKLVLRVFSVLRHWVKKMASYLFLIKDERVSIGSVSTLREELTPIIIKFAQYASDFFSKPGLFSLSIVTCNELLSLFNTPPTEQIVENAMKLLHS